jgi:hypothetical protein
VSDIQRKAAERMRILCVRGGGSCTIEHARRVIPKVFQFALTTEEKVRNASRDEPEWLIAIRNFVRDVGQNKYACFEKIDEGVRLTEAAYELIDRGRIYDVITPMHLHEGGEQLTMEM